MVKLARQNKQKGVIFGLDTRLVLLILAVVSLSVAISKEQQVFKEKKQEVFVELKIIKSSILKHWRELRFKGYFSNDNFSKISTGGTPPITTNAQRVMRIAGLSSVDTLTVSNKGSTTFTNPYNGKDYTSTLKLYKTDGYDFSGNTHYIKVYHNYQTSAFSDTSNSFFDYLQKDVIYRLLQTIDDYASEEGEKSISNTTSSDISGSGESIVSFREDSFDKKIRSYFIVEYNVDKFSLSDYIVTFVLYSLGKDRKLDSTLPTNIDELKNFAAQGDDVFEIFSSKNIYTKAKLERHNRLKDIASKIMNKAEIEYAEIISFCAAEATPTATCDLNSDASYDWQDNILIQKKNPYIKSSRDTSSAVYLDSTTFNFSTATPDINESKTFLKSGLNMPTYLSADLFGNMLDYNSNTALEDEGPYSMEVWY